MRIKHPGADFSDLSLCSQDFPPYPTSGPLPQAVELAVSVYFTGAGEVHPTSGLHTSALSDSLAGFLSFTLPWAWLCSLSQMPVKLTPEETSYLALHVTCLAVSQCL